MREKQPIKTKQTKQRLITKRTSTRQQTKNKQKTTVKPKPFLKKEKMSTHCICLHVKQDQRKATEK